MPFLRSILLLSICLINSSLNAQTDKDNWINSHLSSMTLDEKLGQLITARAHSDRGSDHIAKVKKQIQEYHVGGLCFFQGDIETEAQLTNEYQALSKIPLLISMDAEWGVGMRLKSTAMSFPRQLMLGAIRDDELIYQMGQQVAEHCQRLGIHMNFAPVVDVNNNAANPVINTRSFGEDKMNVTTKAYHYMRGMQDGGILSCAKHFPGHGDTDVDSHYDLPVIPHDISRLTDIELYPFQSLSDQGIRSMMVAHLSVPTLDDRQNTPTTLSYNTVTALLREKMGFDGLIFTDGLEMKGVTKHYGEGEVEARAIEAGNDMLLLPESIPNAISKIKEYLNDGKIKLEQIDESVRRVLGAKFDLGLKEAAPSIVIEGIVEDMNDPKANILKRRLIQAALTVPVNENDLIPIKKVHQKIASVTIGGEKDNAFQKMLSKYAKVKNYHLAKGAKESEHAQLLKDLESYDLVILSAHDLSSYASRGFGLEASDIELIKRIAYSKKSVFVHFGNPYALKYFDGLGVILQCYQEDEAVLEIAAQSLFGAHDITGRLPVTASDEFSYGQGLAINAINRLSYGIPESVGMNSDSLNRIAELIEYAIDTSATPGAVVLVAKKGKVIYEKAFGHHTYDQKRSTDINDIWDLASVTKTSSGTTSIMRLVEQGKINIDERLDRILPAAVNTNKADLTLREIMTHHGGLKPWIPFYKQTVVGTDRRAKPDTKWYRTNQQDDYQISVVDGLYMRSDFQDSIWHQIFESENRDNKNYRYSDLGFIMISAIVEELTGDNIDKYTQEHFYQPLGMYNTGYNPHSRFDQNRLVPSEDDKYFRNRVVQGYVHDMGAAQLGGISGHAGLFSSANDLAILYQALLNGGHYGGVQYFDKEILTEFTTRYEKSTRRGIGFDMKELDTARSQNVSALVSERTFGHLGFTGTCVWVDPDEELVMVILANRTYPTMNNNKWGKMNIRPKVQTAIYNAIIQEDRYN